jgi:glutathione-regulated potassium-efflux system ancillary protein KefC
MDRGVTMIEREIFESSLQMGRAVLTAGLGHNAYRVRQSALKFRKLNIANLQAVYPYYKDREQYESMAKRAREELEEMIARDRRAQEGETRHDWD